MSGKHVHAHRRRGKNLGPRLLDAQEEWGARKKVGTCTCSLSLPLLLEMLPGLIRDGKSVLLNRRRFFFGVVESGRLCWFYSVLAVGSFVR